jgi:hypothetical protein
MGTRPARRGHGGNRDFKLWLPETDQFWRVIRQVSFAEGERKCAAGEWCRVNDGFGNHVGFQILANFKKDEELPSGASSTSITVRECQLNAGLGGLSRTAGMIEEKRISRKNQFGKPLPPEDAIERAQAKVKECAEHRIWDPVKIVDVEFTLPMRPWDAFPDLAREA